MELNSICINCGRFGVGCQGTTEQVWTGCIYKTKTARKFELFFGCLGNGVTVCNKAVMQNGDYKRVAHISNGGNIRFYVPESYIPDAEMEEIRDMANKMKQEFMTKFESLPAIKQYGIILEDEIPHHKFMEFIKDKRSLQEKILSMREYYYTIV